MNVHNFYAAGRRESQLLDAFAATVSGSKGGRLRLDVAHANRLALDDAEALEWLAAGKADLGLLWPVFLQRNNRELQASYVMGSARHLHDHQRAVPALEAIGGRILSEHGLVPIAFLPSPVLYISIFSKGEAVTSLSGLVGRRLRVFSEDLVPTFRRLGADADFIPQGELYAALETGRFDCTVYPACHTSWSVPLWRVTQHAAYLFAEALHPYLLCCSPRAWAELDDGQQAALMDAGESIYGDFLRLSVDNSAEMDARRHLQAAGVTWHADFSAADRLAFGDAAAHTWQAASAAAGGRAPDNFRSVMAAMGRLV